MVKYIFFACLLTIVSQASAIGGRRVCHNCGVQSYYAQPIVHADTTIVVEKQIVTPVRIERYREIPGLRIVEGAHGEQLILLGNKILNLSENKTKIVEEISPRSIVTERIITRSDIYGNKVVTVEKEISK